MDEKLNNMKVMVTGGAGFIGANLIERLVKEGHDVVSLDNYDSGLEENHIDGVKYINADRKIIKNNLDNLSNKSKYTQEFLSRSKYKINSAIIKVDIIDFSKILLMLLSNFNIFVLIAVLNKK